MSLHPPILLPLISHGLLAWTLACTALSAGAAPQDPQGADAPPRAYKGYPILAAAQVGVTTYAAEHMPAPELYETVRRIHGRTFVIEENGPEQLVANMQLLGSGVLVYDTPESTARIVATLRQLDDETLREAHRGLMLESELALLEYTPRHLSLEAVQDALRPFFHELSVVHPVSGQMLSVRSFSVAEARGNVIVRETPEKVAELAAFLERIDVPPPHVTLTCMVLRATRGEGSDALAPELVDHLAQLVPYDRFELLTTGLLTTAVTPRAQLELVMQVDADDRCVIKLRPEAFDADGGALSLSRAEFTYPGRVDFATQVTLHAGEYTVLGAAGPEPILVVLRVVPRG